MKKKINNVIIPACILLFFAISIICIYSTSKTLSINYEHLYLRQIIWYIIGFIIFIIILIVGNDFIFRNAFIFYIVSIILLVIVLILGKEVNNTRGWIELGSISFQPSEFAKLGLILYVSKVLNDYHFEEYKNWKKELRLILKIFGLTLIPSFLVFIEPDTGAVISYFLIVGFLLLLSEVRFRWILIILALVIIIITSLYFFYLKLPNTFIEVFGDGIYYRIFRIIDWQTNTGMQLENSLITIGTSGLTGHGLNNPPLYIPESYTDFIFAVFVSNYGLIGSIVLILIIVIFDFQIIKAILNSSKTIDKYIISGILICFLYPQIQNVAMTIGIIPITGIPLPFISYGGSSLIICFIMIALVMNTSKNSNQKK